ncbi:MAG: MFS transporter, partial [Nanoarchaeota archaeon]|nr:MFS transporter [Nanoarchaeota archaeon]
VFGYCLSCIGYFGYLLIREPWHLFIVQIIFGLGSAVGTPAYDGLYSKHLDKGKFASQWGMWESMAWIVIGVAAASGGFLADRYGFRILFVIMFVISLLGLLTSLFLVVKKKSKKLKKQKFKKGKNQ